MSAGVFEEDLFVGELVTDPGEFFDSHVDFFEDILEGLAEVACWEFSVVAFYQIESLLPGDSASADVKRGDVGGAGKTEL